MQIKKRAQSLYSWKYLKNRKPLDRAPKCQLRLSIKVYKLLCLGFREPTMTFGECSRCNVKGLTKIDKQGDSMKVNQQNIGPLVGFSLLGLGIAYYLFHTEFAQWLLQSFPELRYWPELQRFLIERSMKPTGDVFRESTELSLLGSFIIFVSK
jgi:hypothetical protein